MRAAVMGAGSIGTILGAYIAKAGREIDLIDINVENIAALNKRGATVIGTALFNTPVKAMTPDEMTGAYDLVFYTTKQTYNETALKQLMPHLKPECVVCTLQNGLPEPAVAEAVGEDRTVGCSVGWGASWIGPGVSELTTVPTHLEFDIGSIDGTVTDKVKLAGEYLSLMCPTHILTNLMGVRWAKLLANATFSGMSAALGCTFGDVLDDPFALRCVQYIAKECLDIAKAAKIKLEPIFGNHFDQMLDFETLEEREKILPNFFMIWNAHRALRASMLQDLEKGRKCEIGAINGVVCDFGKKYNVATPVNQKVVDVVRGIEDGKYKIAFSNLALFKSVMPE